MTASAIQWRCQRELFSCWFKKPDKKTSPSNATAQRLFFLPVIYAYQSIRSAQVRQLQKQSWVLHISSCNHPLLKRIPTGESPLGICPVKDSTVILQQHKSMVNDSQSTGERIRTKSRTFFFIMSVSVSRSAEKDSETGRNRLQLCNRISGRLSGKVPVSLRFSLRRVCPDGRKRDPVRVRYCHIMHIVIPAQLEIFCPDPETVSRRKARESESENTGNGLTFAPFLPGKTDRIFCFFHCSFF